MVGTVVREKSPKRTNKSKSERMKEPEKSPKRTKTTVMLEYAAKVTRGNARDSAYEKVLGFGSGLASTPEADETVASSVASTPSMLHQWLRPIGSAATPGTAASLASTPEDDETEESTPEHAASVASTPAETSTPKNPALPIGNGWVIGYSGHRVYLDPKKLKRAYRPPPTPPTEVPNTYSHTPPVGPIDCTKGIPCRLKALFGGYPSALFGGYPSDPIRRLPFRPLKDPRVL